jgi:hypothetical protein
MYKVALEHTSVSKSFGFPPSFITPPTFHIHSSAEVQLKVELTLEQDTKAQRGSRGIVLLFL